MRVRTHALRRLRDAWTQKIYQMKQINQSSRVRPSSPDQVIRIAEGPELPADNTAEVLCGPVVFNVCERADGKPHMYVVVAGRIQIEGSGESSSPLRTIGFGTRVGYFRLKAELLEHVYGAHYDMEGSRDDHPVFHSQLGAMRECFVDQIRCQFRLDAEVRDLACGLLRNVRTPTAQMDFMSVITQLFADHLLGGESSSSQLEAFGRATSACHFLLGAAHRLESLNSERASNCYRSSHWYCST